MSRHNWTIVTIRGSTKISVDYKQRITKITRPARTTYHEGIYPYHNIKPYMKFKNDKPIRY